ncbi:MAG: uracil-DNA glycosylase [Methylococcaceae bacterium]|nr:uracil-DNA glycosylase [Methylococcaceae bacterium]
MEGDDETARIDAVANPLQSQTVDESRPFPLGEGRVRAEALDRSTASSDATGASALTSTPAQESIHKTTATGRAGRLHPPAVAVDVSPSGTWEELHAEVVACQSCPLHRTRTQTVFGVGDRQAQWMVIGEAPGEQEDLQGEPFVGRAGLLLNEMIRAIGLLREQVYIANILKCRPPGNRDPQVDEVAACESFLMRQLALVRPSIILAVGRIAAQQLLKTTTPIGKLRGSVHDYQGVPLVVTYHPAYLLRSPLEKRKAWDDLCLALRTSRTS